MQNKYYLSKISTIFVILISIFSIEVFAQFQTDIIGKKNSNDLVIQNAKKQLYRLYYLGYIKDNSIIEGADGVQVTVKSNPWSPLYIKELNIKLGKRDSGSNIVYDDENEIRIVEDDITIVEKLGADYYFNNLIDEDINSSGLSKLTEQQRAMHKRSLTILNNLQNFKDQSKETMHSGSISWLITNKDIVNKIIYFLDSQGKLKSFGQKEIPSYYKNLVSSLEKVILVNGDRDPLDDTAPVKINSIEIYNKFELSFSPSHRSPLFEPIPFGVIANQNTFNDITQPEYWTNKYEDSYIYLNAFESKLSIYDTRNLEDYKKNVYYDTTSGNIYTGTRYSLFGQWGYDPLYQYGYYSDEVIAGLDISVYSLRRLFHPFINIKLGGVFPFKRPFTRPNPIGNLNASGLGVFAAVSIPILPTTLNQLQLDVEGKYTINKFKKTRFVEKGGYEFYNYHSYFDVGLRWFPPFLKHLTVLPFVDVGNIELSFSLTTVDLREYTFDPMDISSSEIKEKNPKNKSLLKSFDTGWDFKISVVRPFDNSEVKYNVDFFFGQSPWDVYFLGTKIDFLINDWIGFTTKVAVSTEKVETSKTWMKDLYVMFSPTFRISF